MKTSIPICVLPVLLVSLISTVSRAEQYDLPTPAGSGSFGKQVAILSNGNFVVTDPDYDAPGPITNVGAVYLYDGYSLGLISILTGSTPGDKVGSEGVTVLPNGNFLVLSTAWQDGRGAVTWGSPTTGVNGFVSPANSLIGIRAGDAVGRGGVMLLSNDNYLVLSTSWNGGRGAVTWGSGTLGVTGVVSAVNSLVGTTLGDRIGNTEVICLNNGNYLVRSPNWDNGFAANAGAVTFGHGTTGVSGEISAANSLVGEKTNDLVGVGGVTVLSNGNYVVLNPSWHGSYAPGVGAVTWGSGTTGAVGAVSLSNSLLGQATNDQVGLWVVALNNGNYVVSSPEWNNGEVANAGAVTWADGTTGTSGFVSASNSLVGSSVDDRVGYLVTALRNGNYVVQSQSWDNGAVTNAGAVTWCSGVIGMTGVVSVANSLVGGSVDDAIGGVTELRNGNYVIRSRYWDNGAVTNAGAVTWGSGVTGLTGVVSVANSLVGSTREDQVGSGGIIALPNGHYVVESEYWNNGGATNAGAATWCNGNTGATGVVSAANSLVGSRAYDRVGFGNPAVVLANGNYVLASPWWDNGSATNAGAVTFANGLTGVTGVVSVANSLVGSSSEDRVGTMSQLYFSNYVVRIPNWDNGTIANVGAVTWCSGITGRVGVISAANSLIGSQMNDQVGSGELTLLNSGNYVLRHSYWNNGTITNAGAVTLCTGIAELSGYVSPANSLVGGQANDRVGSGPASALSNGNYVVLSPSWHNDSGTNVGAATWSSGTTGIVGLVSPANSLVGSTAGDLFGSSVTTLNDGNFLVRSLQWHNGTATFAGAGTWGNADTGVTGVISSTNSVLGTVANGAYTMNYLYEPVYSRLLVCYPADNRVSTFGHFPHLTVQQPANINLPPAGTRTVYAALGVTGSLTLLLKNTGLNDLTISNLAIDGPDAAQFTIPNPFAVPLFEPMGSANLTVQFAPTTLGTKTATLHITSNDPDQNPFDINLVGQVLSFTEDTDGDGLSDGAEFQLASLGFDWQARQTNLVNALYNTANSAGLYTPTQVEALNLGTPLLAKDPSTGLFTLTIGVQKATQLTNFAPFPMTAPQTTINGQGKLEFQFSAPDDAAFFRLEAR